MYEPQSAAERNAHELTYAEKLFLAAEVCGGTGNHDGQAIADCDECCPSGEYLAPAMSDRDREGWTYGGRD